MTSFDLTAARAGGMCNLRDVGGLPTASGGWVRRGVLYRGDAPQPDDPEPPVRPWPPRTVIDLRSVDERPATHPLAAHRYPATVHQVQLAAEANPLTIARRARDEGAEAVIRSYLWMAKARAEQLVRLVDIVAEGPAPVLIHCSAGKDRTGVSIALLLSAVGVSRDDIIADFLRSNDNIDMIAARITLFLNSEAVAVSGEEAHRTNMVRAEAIAAVLDRFESHPGGTVGWLTDHGLPAERARTLRETLVEDGRRPGD